ncbi:hypothetical protein JRO89_XS05G0068700 [Xanthoceras sorbifolium]|uniref:Response regulatory domain-containing protein n=1 Tax=Xanthoceras sorbifolium TaxID=99658 RepID=A0ABQ8I0R7_9ROSI|nr:hypothetical protein JRO89_XS05G0068700 [Xanthoceras sorbifolium]
MTTTANGVASWRRISDKIDGFDLSPSKSDEVHVLAVDDSFVDRKVIERLLTISSCKVTAVDSGRRALQFLGLDEEENTNSFDGLKVDLIITDYCMPGMTGYELLKKIKESSTFKEIPVVIMSSENVLARIDRRVQEDFIVKPVKLADVKRIKDCMTREIKLGNEESGINKRSYEKAECEIVGDGLGCSLMKRLGRVGSGDGFQWLSDYCLSKAGGVLSIALLSKREGLQNLSASGHGWS